MCIFLAAMPAIALAMSAASAGMAAYGSISSANAQSATAKYQSKIAVDQGEATANANALNEQQTYKQGDQAGGLARAALGANGVDVGSGTALQTQKDIGLQTGRNVANEDYGSKVAQWGAVNQSGLLNAQAGFDQQAGAFGQPGASALVSGGSVPAGWGSNGGSVGVGSWAGGFGS